MCLKTLQILILGFTEKSYAPFVASQVVMRNAPGSTEQYCQPYDRAAPVAIRYEIQMLSIKILMIHSRPTVVFGNHSVC